MHPDLMRPPGLQDTFYIGMAPEPLQHTVMGDRGLSAAFCHSHLLPVGGMTANGPVDDPLILLQYAMTDCLIAPCQRVLLQLGRNAGMCPVVLAGDDGARGIHVDPVDDAGPKDPVDSRELLPAVIQQRVHQRPAVMARRRMHHHALGLVHDNDISVFIQDVQRDVLRQDIRLHSLRQKEGKLLLRLHPIAPLYGDAVHRDGLFLYQLLDKGARQRIDKHGKTLIDSLPFPFFSYLIAEFIRITEFVHGISPILPVPFSGSSGIPDPPPYRRT